MCLAGSSLRPTILKKLREGWGMLHSSRKRFGCSLCHSLLLLSYEIHRHQPGLYTLYPNPKFLAWQKHKAQIIKIKRYYSQKKLFDRVPPNSWDSHMHVVDPDSYPLAVDAQYTPTSHTLSQALSFYSTIGISNMVFVQPSIYGNDNSCMLDALRTIGPQRGRAVVTFDPSIIPFETLQEWHAIGVRGVRLNLQSVGKEMDAAELATTLQQYAKVIRPLNWVLQLYVPLKMATSLEKIVPDLGVRVCLDHFGHPPLPDPSAKELYTTTSDPYTLSGFSSLINLLRQGSTYVKLSAPYRIAKEEGQGDLEPVARELLEVAGKRNIVFATDWPHTRFEGLDIKPFIDRALEWCGDDQELMERLFRGNAEDLWDVKP